MTTTCGGTKLRSTLGIFVNQLFYAHFSLIMVRKMKRIDKIQHFSAYFYARISTKLPILKISQKYSLTLFPQMLWSHDENFFHLEPKFQGMNGLVGDILNFHFCLESFERSYQISEIEIVMTFERKVFQSLQYLDGKQCITDYHCFPLLI